MEIAIIAHDGMKVEKVHFLKKHKAILLQKNIKLIIYKNNWSRAEKARLWK